MRWIAAGCDRMIWSRPSERRCTTSSANASGGNSSSVLRRNMRAAVSHASSRRSAAPAAGLGRNAASPTAAPPFPAPPAAVSPALYTPARRVLRRRRRHCRAPLTPQQVAAIEAGMDRYAVLVFRDQDLSDEQQIAFSRHFGALEDYARPGHIRRREDSRLGPGMADLSNLDKNGNIIPAEDRVWFFKLGDRLWHSDSSFRPIPAKYSLLSARALPSWGGNTEFADMRAAYDALDARTKAEVEDLICEHSLMYSRGAIGLDDWS